MALFLSYTLSFVGESMIHTLDVCMLYGLISNHTIIDGYLMCIRTDYNTLPEIEERDEKFIDLRHEFLTLVL